MGLSTHILDTALGRPAAKIAIALAERCNAEWQQIGSGITDQDGRCKTLLGANSLVVATYKLRFEVAEYFERSGLQSLYPYVEIVFEVTDASQHYHIPLLLTANGYTTYRGS
jgi:5-hydroxyisourate hydrolase